MVWDSDTSTDHQYLDGVVSVTYDTPAGTEVTGLSGIPNSIRESDVASNPSLGITTNDRSIIVYHDASLVANPLASQGTITYGSVTYRILTVDHIENGQQYRCLLRKQR